MSAVLASMSSVSSPHGDTSHVEAAVHLLRKAKEEVERRALAFEYFQGLADGIHSEVSVDVLSTDMNEVIDALQSNIVDGFVRLARERFAPEGGSLAIEARTYRENHLPIYTNDVRRDDFDPRKVWADIYNDWGRGRGEIEGYKQAAKAIIDFFWIKRGKPVEIVRGNTVLSKSIYVDDHDKKWNGRNRMSHNSRSNFDPMSKHFETFGAWCGMPCFARGYLEMLSKWGYSTDVVSRERFTLGARAFVVMYLKQVEFHLAPDLAAQLNLFLQTFGDMEEA